MGLPTVGNGRKKALLLVWDNASWHVSRAVRRWIRAHNRQAKQHGVVRIVTCQLPTKSPGLNPLEPRWMHGKRAVAESDHKLTAHELINRVYDHFGCEHLRYLTQEVS